MSHTRKTDDAFASVDGDSAVYTNDVDKPYPLPEAEPTEAPDRARPVDPPAVEEFYADAKADKSEAPKAEDPVKRPAPKAAGKTDTPK